MKTRNFLLIAIVLLCTVTTGCKQTQKKNNMLGDGQEPITIPIVLKDCDKPLDLAQYIDTMFFVPLEIKDSAFVSRIGIVELYGDRIFYLNDIIPQGYSFNTQGKFLTRLIQPGKGPKEVTSPSSMYLDRPNERLIICDRTKSALHLVSLDGEYIKEVKTKRWICAIHGMTNHDSYLMMADDEESNLFWVENNFKSFKPIEGLPLESELSTTGTSRPFSSLSDGSVNLSVGYSQSVMNFSDSTFYQKYFFDFGKLHIPPEIKGPARSKASYDHTKNYVGGIFGFKEIQNHLVFHFNTNFTNSFTAIVRKPNMDIKLFSSISFAGFLFNRNTWFINANADDWFLGVIFDNMLEESLEKNNELSPQEQKLRSAILEMKHDDNPIYVFFKLKGDA